MVRRPDHARLVDVLRDGRSGPGARCDRCDGETDLSGLDRATAELVLGDFFRHHRACRPPIDAEKQRRRSRTSLTVPVDPDALRQRAQELLAAARERAAGSR